MQVIVSDTSCLIDLRKTSLLESFMNLPYEIMIPDTLFEDELLKFSELEKTVLLDKGLQVIELPGAGVLRAQAIESSFPALSIHDCFVFALAERHPICILLTGDKALRKIATGYGIEVHGVLWAMQAIRTAETATIQELIAALELFERDDTVHLPTRKIRALIKDLK